MRTSLWSNDFITSTKYDKSLLPIYPNPSHGKLSAFYKNLDITKIPKKKKKNSTKWINEKQVNINS